MDIRNNLMSNLVIGSTSQLAHYFPASYEKISSYECFKEISKKQWNEVYLCFGENRTYLSNSSDSTIINSFYEINCKKTIETVNLFLNTAKKIVVFSTSELWNDYTGPVSLSMPFKFRTNHYTSSKYQMSSLLSDKKNYPNVSIAYPFNFNGVYRNGNFLFGKVFNSIIHNKKIELNDTYFYRDLLHPSIVVEECRNREIGEDFVIGSGRLTFVNDLIRNLYEAFDMKYENMVQEKILEPGFYQNKIFYSKHQPLCQTATNILDLLVKEIQTKYEN